MDNSLKEKFSRFCAGGVLVMTLCFMAVLTVQAFGWALYEQLHYDGGRLANGNFADYTIPTADSVPMLRGGFVESNDPNGPYGAKGASETAILPGAPAIANAVFDAVGVRITDLPITPEKVLAALRDKGQEEATHA